LKGQKLEEFITNLSVLGRYTKMNERKPKLILIGCGRWAGESHLPALKEYYDTIELVASASLDLEKSKEQLNKHGFQTNNILNIQMPDDVVEIARDRKAGWYKAISKIFRNKIGTVLNNPGLDAAIIATYNVHHYAYIRWCLENGIHVLTDKPITITPSCCEDIYAANRIWSEYLELVKIAKKNNLLFMVATQRRYQPHYNLIQEEIKRVYNNADQRVTFIQCITSDGWWDEPTRRGYNPRESGGCKMSHTGYHLFDIIPWLLRASNPDIDKAEISVRFQRRKELHPTECESNAEINAGIQIAFFKNDEPDCLVQISMLHEGFSKNFGVEGRTKHEEMTIHQGPIFAVWLRRLAKLLDNPNESEDDYKVGDRNNNELFFAVNKSENGKLKNYHPGENLEVVPLSNVFYDASQIGYLDCDEEPSKEYLKVLLQKPSYTSETQSSAQDHWQGVKLLSAAYLSGIQNGRWIKVDLRNPF
jgi:predicted dehydrogenase